MSDARPNLSKRPAAAKNPGSAALAPRPPAALGAVAAMAAAGVLGVLASIGLFVQKTWIYTTSLKSLTDTNNKAKAKDKKSAAHLRQLAHDQIATTHKGAVIGGLILVVALAFVGSGIYRGRYWARWGTIGLWVLCTFTNTLIGLGALLTVTGNIPGVVKVPAFLGAVALIVAVVLVNMKPAARWFALSKPVPAAGAPARRGGLFGPRPAAGGARAATGTAQQPATTRPAGPASPDRARSKKRAAEAQASAARGADLARTRAKAASKSRRTEA